MSKTMAGDRENLRVLLERALECVDESAARKYATAWPVLSMRVSDDLSRRPNVSALIGGHPLSVMQSNHECHGAFISAMLVLRAPDCLTDVLVWVYHSYLSRGFDPDYFIEEISAWRSAIRRHIGRGAKVEALLAFYDSLAKAHPCLLKLAGEISATPRGHVDGLAALFLGALLEGDSEQAEGITRQFVEENPKGLQLWWTNVVAPAMHAVGDGWADGRLSVAEEHVATAIAQRAMDRVGPTSSRLGLNGKCVLVALPPGERHEMAGRMLRDCLAGAGFGVVFTGADTPAESIVGHVLMERFDAVVLPTTMPYNLIATKDLIAAIRTSCGNACPKIIVGGQAYLWDERLFRSVGADSCHQSVDDFLKDLESMSPSVQD